MPLAAALVATLAAAPLSGPIAELASRLDALGARTPLRVSFAHHFDSVSGDGKDAVRASGDARGELAEDEHGLRIAWDRADLDRAREEARRRATDGDARTPTRDAIAALDAIDLAAYLDAADQLRQALEGATLLEDRSEPLDGAPARLLVLKLDPKLGARERRYVKEVEATARLWLGEDGLPRAAERRVKLSGRAMLVIGFEQEERESYRFERHGDRLVAVRHEAVRRGEGGGDKGERRSRTTLAVAPAPGAGGGAAR